MKTHRAPSSSQRMRGGGLPWQLSLPGVFAAQNPLNVSGGAIQF
jgi:hypothetical protein